MTREEIVKAADEDVDMFKQCMFSDGVYDATKCAILHREQIVTILEDLLEKSIIYIGEHKIESFSIAKMIHNSKTILTELKSRI